MTKEQEDILEHMRQSYKAITSEGLEYWRNFSSASTWQFWVCLAMLVIPLVVLFFCIDKRKALQMGFFGFNIHIWFSYIDQFAVLHGLWEFPYKIIPFSPVGFLLDVSLLPVSYILVYQWTVNSQRNRYLYLILLGAVIAFIFKPILSWLDLFKMEEWMNFGYVFIANLIVILISIWITAFFLHMQKSVDIHQKRKI